MSTATLAVDSVTETMLVGKIVKVRICEVATTPHGLEYHVEYMGDRICLDFGEKWYVEGGYRFTTRQVNIDRAAEWRAKGY